MSFQYIQPTDEQKAQMQEFRDKYQALSDDLNKINVVGPAMQNCFDRLKESAMWLNRALTNND